MGFYEPSLHFFGESIASKINQLLPFVTLFVTFLRRSYGKMLSRKAEFEEVDRSHSESDLVHL